MFKTVTPLILSILLAIPVHADEPLLPPSEHEVSSRNQAFIAVSSPEEGTRIIDKATGLERWSIPGWHRWLFVADDGNHVVTGYDGMNLIPTDYDDDLTLLTFWVKGEKIREIHLEDIIPDKSILVRTVSHYHWGSIAGFNETGDLVVERRDGKLLYFNPDTGRENP